ncbi:hypothetical protein SCOCK_710006 [Actinacidiphila cocklensis]|uniref:Uncharacterized protein n=1 Tax=Actinacidiphila cocklensis TaxID=887465 RepID=A0A9W4DZ13_9ACTN|nr:hypothetical protein SCOCK_710006 [Actinacidiphila cocklensis]
MCQPPVADLGGALLRGAAAALARSAPPAVHARERDQLHVPRRRDRLRRLLRARHRPRPRPPARRRREAPEGNEGLRGLSGPPADPAPCGVPLLPFPQAVPVRGAGNCALSHPPRAGRHRPEGAVRSVPDGRPVGAERAVPRAPLACPLPEEAPRRGCHPGGRKGAGHLGDIEVI